jgi:hypothetical protein
LRGILWFDKIGSIAKHRKENRSIPYRYIRGADAMLPQGKYLQCLRLLQVASETKKSYCCIIIIILLT